MDFLRKLLEQVKNLWGKWSLRQKLILAGIIVVAIIGIGALVSVSSTPSTVKLYDRAITDEDLRDRIMDRINQEGYTAQVSANGIISVDDIITARKMRVILIREGLLPQGISPWETFDRQQWTITDFERNTNLQRAIKQMVIDHIKAIEGIDDAKISIVFPKDKLYLQDQNPVSVSVSLIPTPGSDITENRKKIEGIQKILKYAIEGLKDEGIVITDHTGMILNDSEDWKGIDEHNLVKRQQNYIADLENKYRALILTSLQGTFSEDRVRYINVKFNMDMSKKAVSTTKYLPFEVKPRTPGSVYDDSLVKDSVTSSQEEYTSTFKGTGFNPEGPPGMEPNVMPDYQDVANVHGTITYHATKNNEKVGSETTEEERKPQIDRVTVSVNIDGTWNKKYDEKGRPVILANNAIEREYFPIDPADLKKTQALVQDAIGFKAARGDSVTVQNIPYDRTREFAEEDAAYFRQQNIQRTVVFFLIGLAVLLIAFVIFRLVSKVIERQRLAAEEALARERQAARERALLEAEQEGVEVSMSVEERKRMELQENVISLAKDHPEDAAQLIRTWLLED